MLKREKRTVWGLALILFLYLPLTFAHAQSREDEEEYLSNKEDVQDIDLAHDKVIKIHPFQLGEIYLSYEKMRTSRVSNETGIGYVYASGLEERSDWQNSIKSTTGVAIRMSQRHYTSKRKTPPFGFFHGAMFGYKFLLFEEDALGVTQAPNAPTTPIGRLYQNSLELNYQIGGQFQLGRHFTMEVAGMLGARLKYARARNADTYLRDKVIGHVLRHDEHSVATVVPSPQLKLSVGYSF
ncbi:ABC transporter ATP-binding protein [Pontibacter harenae]|uniref:ABC transporter ATP-binding protein n=1 Tax=Pontibacter harenae TaxID=2894083 RepID=UPI001E3252D3|nr:ABC transporter ATP-binding protein [Pontibacter harenae]MCC9165220.1 ABC transporter ATP-binding protein [Pontibacter harenae]